MMQFSKRSFRFLSIAAACVMISACSTQAVTPDAKDVKVSRAEPHKDCKMISKVSGTTSSAKAKPEDALKDMTQEAANKGANYLRVLEYSAYGTSVTGVAYECP